MNKTSFPFGWLSASSIVLLLVWAIGCIYMLGLVPVPTESASSPSVKTVKLLVRTGAESEAMAEAIPPFEAETGLKVELIELGRDGYFTALATQLFAGTDAFDVAFIPSTYIAQFSQAKVIVPLDPFIGNPDLTDASLFDISDFLTTYSVQDQIYALPTDISTHLLYYRSDLIPSPPETWEQLLEQARTLTRTHNASSSTKWGLAMTGKAPEELPKVFDTVLWSFGGELLGNDGLVYLDTQAGVAAGDYMAQLVKERVLPPDVLSMGFSDVRDALLRGDVAMAAPYWNAAYSAIKGSPYPIKVALIPGKRLEDGSIRRIPFHHGWGLAINASSQHQEEAWRLLSYLTGKRGGMIYARAGGTPARKSILADPLLWNIRPEFPHVLESMKTARNEPPLTFYPLLVDIENEALTEILTLHKTPATALQESANKLRRLEIHDRFSKLAEERADK